MIKQRPENNFEPIETLVMESLFSKAIIFALKIKLFNYLEDNQEIKDLAIQLEIPEKKLEALLELFRARNLLVKTNNKYKNSSLASEYLVSNSVFYQGELLEMQQTMNENVNNNIEELIKSKDVAPNKLKYNWDSEKFLFGCQQYSLQGSLQDTIELIISLPGFNNMQSMCDIGGNHGLYTLTLLDYNPHMSATIADLPNITPYTTKCIAPYSNKKQITILPFNLKTDQLPVQNFDFILISHVLHMFIDDLDNIVEKISTYLKPGGWLICQQMNQEKSQNEMYKTSKEFITRLMGPKTHFIKQEHLEKILQQVGFTRTITRKSGYNNENMLIASQKA